MMSAFSGSVIRLEDLTMDHVPLLAAAASHDRERYRWSMVPNGRAGMERYVETALAWKNAGTALPFAIVRQADDQVIGSTRLFDIESWAWPMEHERHGGGLDGAEIGYSWLTGAAMRTAANTEAKLLLLRHAFEQLGVFRICFHTDARNERSRSALERIGATFEGTLRAHRLASDFTPRDSLRFSIVASEWPSVKAHLLALLDRTGAR
jgi:N-acetyltransferase